VFHENPKIRGLSRFPADACAQRYIAVQKRLAMMDSRGITMTQKYWALTLTTAMVALAASAAFAGQPAAGPHTQVRAEIHINFGDNDRQATRTWYEAHQRSLPVGLRVSDRFSPEVELQFQAGYVIDKRMRGQVHDVPPDLRRLLAPAPRGYRYIVIGGHIVLVDSGYRVYDVIHVGHER
jgi:Ni/Co efflux regulator RcnB